MLAPTRCDGGPLVIAMGFVVVIVIAGLSGPWPLSMGFVIVNLTGW